MSQDFWLPQLNVSIDASYALLSGESTQVFDGSATVQVYVPLNNVRSIFLFQTDSSDIDNIVPTDIRYQTQYTGIHTKNLDFDLDTSAVLITGDIDPGATNRNLTYDYVRYLALKLFNTHLGVDLFSNETELRENLRDRFNEEFDNNMKSFSGIYTDANGNSPSKSILLQIINNQASRLNNISSLQSAEFYNWYSVPVLAGDNLYFRLTVNAAINQHTLTNVNSISPRVYLIKATIVA